MTMETTAPASTPLPGAADTTAPAASSDTLEAPEEPATTIPATRPARSSANGRTAKTARGAGALPVSIADIWRAQDVLRKTIAHTPMIQSRTFSAMTGANV
ncbi:MAG TPA: hypothetical protein VH593_05980, partial [Ktedonobacteraceae bacterium]